MKRIFSFLLVALMAGAVVVSCNKDEDTSANNSNNSGNGGGGGTPAVTDGISVKFMGNTWNSGYIYRQNWIIEYEQAYYVAFQKANALDDQPNNLYPYTDGFVYPDVDAEQDYFCNYYKEGHVDISSIVGLDESFYVGDYFWYPDWCDGMMTLSNVNFDAASLTINNMKMTIPMYNTVNFFNNQDETVYNEEVTFHNVALEEISVGDGKSNNKMAKIPNLSIK